MNWTIVIVAAAWGICGFTFGYLVASISACRTIRDLAELDDATILKLIKEMKRKKS